ncbi:MAG: hypothetical protein RQ743_12710 [Bacteroidales bacterium]|nr:hypothetical protein [Bacteroidales bacterium]
MKNKSFFKLGITLLAGAIIMVSCEKDDDFMNPMQDSVLKTLTSIPLNADIIGYNDLIAGQTEYVGQVALAKSETHFFMQVTVDEHLIEDAAVYAGSIDNMPVNNAGNPTIGKFPYKYENEPVDQVVFAIPLDGLIQENGCIVDVVVHVALTNGETAWAKPGDEQKKVAFLVKANISHENYDWLWAGLHGDAIWPTCYWGKYFGYFEVDLNNFQSNTYALSYLWDHDNYNSNDIIGYAEVDYSEGSLNFTITSAFANRNVNKSYVYVGSIEEIENLSLLYGCPQYTLFPDKNETSSLFHYHSVYVGETNTSYADIDDIESTRWMFYIPKIKICL